MNLKKKTNIDFDFFNTKETQKQKEKIRKREQFNQTFDDLLWGFIAFSYFTYGMKMLILI